MICYAIYHQSSCTCGSCMNDNNYNDRIFFDEDSIIQAIQDNPKPSQYSDNGRHTIHELEYEKSSNGIVFSREGYSINLEIDPTHWSLPESYWIDEKLIELLCRNSSRQYTIDAGDNAALTKWRKEWSDE